MQQGLVRVDRVKILPPHRQEMSSFPTLLAGLASETKSYQHQISMRSAAHELLHN